MVILRPPFLKPGLPQAIPAYHDNPGFICHPSTSELAEQLMIDPESLSNENYSGLYDESGDYVPQYCDNPDDIPRGMSIDANKESTDKVPASKSVERETGTETPPPAETPKTE